MKDSFCGLCDHCQLGSPDFQAAAAKVKTCVDRLPAFWQRQGFIVGSPAIGNLLRRLRVTCGFAVCDTLPDLVKAGL